MGGELPARQRHAHFVVREREIQIQIERRVKDAVLWYSIPRWERPAAATRSVSGRSHSPVGCCHYFGLIARTHVNSCIRLGTCGGSAPITRVLGEYIEEPTRVLHKVRFFAHVSICMGFALCVHDRRVGARAGKIH